MPLRGSHLAAIAIAAGIGGWMWTGNVIVGGQGPEVKQNMADVLAGGARDLADWFETLGSGDEPAARGVTIAEREASEDQGAFRVRVTSVQPSERVETLEMRGRTEADARVSVKAETAGTVEQRLVSKGDDVKPGDALCVIDQGTRETSLAQAAAALEQAQADYDANVKLLERGFTTRTRVRGLKTALDAAKAQVANAKLDMTNTTLTATVAGRVEDPIAETGDYLRPGDTCVTLVDSDPMLFIGQVSERQIAKLELNQPVDVRLVDGRTVSGPVRFIAPTADERTRTFRVEVALDNGDNSLREGVTAEADVPLDPVQAYKLSPSWLTLSDDGEVGVRVVDANDSVAFAPVTIIAQTGDGAWVIGLEPGARVITLGQNFVSIGERVIAVPTDTPTSQVAPVNSLETAGLVQ